MTHPHHTRTRAVRSAVAAATAVVAALTATGCAETAEPAQRGVFAVLFSTSSSDTGESDLHLRQLRDVVVPAAIESNALVRVTAVTGDGATRPITLAEVDFSAPATFGEHGEINDNPEVVAEHEAALEAELFEQLDESLTRLEPSTRSDPFGGWSGAADLFADSGDADYTLVALGDMVSTTETCNLNVLLADPDAPLDEIAGGCLGPRPVDLGGADIWVIGGGTDLDTRLDPVVATNLRPLVDAAALRANATVTRWGAALVDRTTP